MSNEPQSAGSDRPQGGPGRIRVHIADDHLVMRQGLRAFLEKEPDMVVVGESADGAAAVDDVSRTDPDVLVLDIMMPVMDGLEACRRLTRLGERPAILILTMHEQDRFLMAAFRAGAKGYCLKSAGIEDLIRAIRVVAAGQVYLSPGVAPRILHKFTGEAPPSPVTQLTAREREVLQLVAEGHSTRQIAAKLCVSPKTIDVHRIRIMKKLNTHSVAELTKYAIRQGLTSEF